MLVSFLIIFFHFIFDIYLQNSKWAEKKSHNFKSLIKHTCLYSFCWIIVTPLFMKVGLTTEQYIESAFIFGVITFAAHTITDYFTSKRASKLFKEGKLGTSIPNHGFFSMIFFDQILHYAQLFLTLNYVYNLY